MASRLKKVEETIIEDVKKVEETIIEDVKKVEESFASFWEAAKRKLASGMSVMSIVREHIEGKEKDVVEFTKSMSKLEDKSEKGIIEAAHKF